jgi:hypothetical protein
MARTKVNQVRLQDYTTPASANTASLLAPDTGGLYDGVNKFIVGSNQRKDEKAAAKRKGIADEKALGVTADKYADTLKWRESQAKATLDAASLARENSLADTTKANKRADIKAFVERQNDLGIAANKTRAEQIKKSGESKLPAFSMQATTPEEGTQGLGILTNLYNSKKGKDGKPRFPNANVLRGMDDPTKQLLGNAIASRARMIAATGKLSNAEAQVKAATEFISSGALAPGGENSNWLGLNADDAQVNLGNFNAETIKTYNTAQAANLGTTTEVLEAMPKYQGMTQEQNLNVAKALNGDLTYAELVMKWNPSVSKVEAEDYVEKKTGDKNASVPRSALEQLVTLPPPKAEEERSVSQNIKQGIRRAADPYLEQVGNAAAEGLNSGLNYIGDAWDSATAGNSKYESGMSLQEKLAAIKNNAAVNRARGGQ